MATPHLCTILPFRAPHSRAAPPPAIDEFALEQLGFAEDHLTVLTADIEAATANVLAGVPLAGLGGMRTGRALTWACRLVLALVNLRGNPEADHDLSRAARAWLQHRETAGMTQGGENG